MGNVDGAINIIEADKMKGPYACETGLMEMASLMEFHHLTGDHNLFELCDDSEPAPAREDTWARMGKAVQLAKPPTPEPSVDTQAHELVDKYSMSSKQSKRT